MRLPSPSWALSDAWASATCNHIPLLAGDTQKVQALRQEVQALRQEAHDFATKLNGRKSGILADEDAPSCVLQRIVAAKEGSRSLVVRSDSCSASGTDECPRSRAVGLSCLVSLPQRSPKPRIRALGRSAPQRLGREGQGLDATQRVNMSSLALSAKLPREVSQGLRSQQVGGPGVRRIQRLRR